MSLPPFDESAQDQTVASSHISSLEKYKFLVDQEGLIRVRTRDDFDGLTSPNGLSPTQKIINIGFGRTQSLDAFGRLRMSTPFDLFDNKNISSHSPDLFDQVTVGSGAVNYNSSTASVILSIDGNNNDRALRQTKYLPYIPGKSQVIDMTGVLSNKPIESMSIVLRSNVSGSVVDVAVPQSQWNRDKVDGTGLSGVTVDFTKGQIFQIDFQWLALGNIRFAIMSNTGSLIEVHEIRNPNTSAVAYMRTPTLPMRYEIVSDGAYIYSRIGYFDDGNGVFFQARILASQGPVTLSEICCSCATEAGMKPTGLEYHANTRGVTVTADTIGVNLIAIKCANTYQGRANRKTGKLISSNFYAAGQVTYFETYKVIDYSADTSTWVDVDTYSGMQVARGSGINITATRSFLIASNIIAASGSGPNANPGDLVVSVPPEVIDQHRTIRQNYDSTKSEIILIRAFTLTSTTAVAGAITWFEEE